MGKEKHSYKFQKDILPIIFTILAIFCACISAILIINPAKDLNNYIGLIYLTIATLTSSLLEPILKLLKINKNKSKMVSLGLSTIILLGIFVYTFHSGKDDLTSYIISFSKRGGFTAVSITLLLFQLAIMEYENQIETERDQSEENKNNRKREHEEKEKELGYLKKIAELEKELKEKEPN